MSLDWKSLHTSHKSGNSTWLCTSVSLSVSLLEQSFVRARLESFFTDYPESYRVLQNIYIYIYADIYIKRERQTPTVIGSCDSLVLLSLRSIGQVSGLETQAEFLGYCLYVKFLLLWETSGFVLILIGWGPLTMEDNFIYLKSMLFTPTYLHI